MNKSNIFGNSISNTGFSIRKNSLPRQAKINRTDWSSDRISHQKPQNVYDSNGDFNHSTQISLIESLKQKQNQLIQNNFDKYFHNHNAQSQNHRSHQQGRDIQKQQIKQKMNLDQSVRSVLDKNDVGGVIKNLFKNQNIVNNGGYQSVNNSKNMFYQNDNSLYYNQQQEINGLFAKSTTNLYYPQSQINSTKNRSMLASNQQSTKSLVPLSSSHDNSQSRIPIFQNQVLNEYTQKQKDQHNQLMQSNQKKSVRAFDNVQVMEYMDRFDHKQTSSKSNFNPSPINKNKSNTQIQVDFQIRQSLMLDSSNTLELKGSIITPKQLNTNSTQTKNFILSDLQNSKDVDNHDFLQENQNINQDLVTDFTVTYNQYQGKRQHASKFNPLLISNKNLFSNNNDRQKILNQSQDQTLKSFSKFEVNKSINNHQQNLGYQEKTSYSLAAKRQIKPHHKKRNSFRTLSKNTRKTKNEQIESILPQNLISNQVTEDLSKSVQQIQDQITVDVKDNVEENGISKSEANNLNGNTVKIKAKRVQSANVKNRIKQNK
eukprot:403357312